jgi:monooxygenase
MTTEHVDVLIIGAGISGIGAAAHLGQHLPDLTYAVLEGRESSGGTWDLFKYPGIRSDSDMFTFGFRWEPWPSDRSLADGPSIMDYLRSVSTKYGVEDHIRYRHRVTAAAWSSAEKQWTVSVETPEGPAQITADFLWSCTGYYDYDQGYQPEFPGIDRFRGTFVHPQHWPEDLDYAGKRVVVIGSGATAVTLVPAMADKVEHITMLQRTPSFVFSRPGRDPLARGLAKALGRVPSFVPFKRLREGLSYEALRWANIGILVGTYQLAQRRPAYVRKVIRDGVVEHLTARPGQPGMTREEAEAYADTHFNPPYDPWDQRLCAVPDGDLFAAIRTGKAGIVTDRIATFVEDGIELATGERLEADIVISATGLNVRFFGGVDVTVDGEHLAMNERMAYRGLMLSEVPNLFFTIGYTNASWTLKVDLVSRYVVRLLERMRRQGHREVIVRRDPAVGSTPFMDMQSGYLLRAADAMPRKGDRGGWQVKQNYLVDMRALAKDLDGDRELQFS